MISGRAASGCTAMRAQEGLSSEDLLFCWEWSCFLMALCHLMELASVTHGIERLYLLLR
jgi:hypothetical protein